MNRTYVGGIIFAVAFITASTIVMNLPVSAKNVPYEDFGTSDDKILTEEAESHKTGQIRENSGMSGMPCENREQFERWYANYNPSAEGVGNEQKTNEEATEVQRMQAEELETTQTGCEIDKAEVHDPERETEVEIAPTYSVGNEALNRELQEYLHDALKKHSIDYWYEIAVCQIFQESGNDQYKVSDDGKDYGLLQYRAEFWSWERGDIFDPYVQIDLYAEQMAKRLNSGLSADECISRHFTSDYVTEVNWKYVSDVKQHLQNLRKVD